MEDSDCSSKGSERQWKPVIAQAKAVRGSRRHCSELKDLVVRVGIPLVRAVVQHNACSPHQRDDQHRPICLHAISLVAQPPPPRPAHESAPFDGLAGRPNEPAHGLKLEHPSGAGESTADSPKRSQPRRLVVRPKRRHAARADRVGRLL